MSGPETDPASTPPEDMARPTGRPCAICGKPAVQRFRPFCSGRCADVDLHRWLVGGYVLPGDESEPSGDDEDDTGPH